MKSLFDYSFLVEEVFYRGYPILTWLEKHPSMSLLDKKAIQATIMDALVYKGLIDSEKESLDLEHLCTVNNLKHYTYELYPDVCGIPQWMKEEFRKKAIAITGGVPISLFLTKPTSKIARYCVYDPNTAVSSIFPDATFYNVFYLSPTRGVKIEEPRPFVEIDVGGGVYYLVDILTKRIFKSSFFRENYGFEIKTQKKVSTMNNEERKIYDEMIEPKCNLNTLLPFYLMMKNTSNLSFAEMFYELEKSKGYFPEEWEKYEVMQEEIENFIRIRN